MKNLFFLAVMILFVIDVTGQPKATTQADYSGTFQYAVSETNAAFPFIFTVVVEEFEKGKNVLTETEINERQSAGIERNTRTIIKGEKKTVEYQLKVGFGNVYCSNDNVSWQGPQKYECSGPSRMYGRMDTESAEYSLEEKTVGAESLKIYREYIIYKPAKDGSEKKFKETIATIDSRGFFISIINKEGSFNTKLINLLRKQTWDFKTPIKSIVAPK